MERDLSKKASQKQNSKLAPIEAFTPPKVWTICSGKGGIGKTFVSTSLAISLAKLGHEVVICDLDMSGANVHTALGVTPSHLNIRHYLEGSKTLQECVIPTPIAKVKFIQGFWDTWMPTQLTAEQIFRIYPDLKKLRADFVIVDLGAGAMEGNLAAFSESDEKILVTNAEPTSIEKTYRFVEAFICNSLRPDMSVLGFQALIQNLQDYRHRVHSKAFNLVSFLSEFEPASAAKFHNLNAKPIRLLVNGARLKGGSEIGYGIKSVCQKFFDLRLDYLGCISYDNAVWQAMTAREPVLLSQPFTPLAGQFVTICKQLIDPQELSALA